MVNLNLLWINPGVEIYTPHRIEFFQELFKSKKLKIYSLNDFDKKYDKDDIHRLNQFIKEKNIDFILLEPIQLIESRLDNAFLKRAINFNKYLIENCRFLMKNYEQLECKKILIGTWLDIHSFTMDDRDIFLNFLKGGNLFYGVSSKNISFNLDPTIQTLNRKPSKIYHELQIHDNFKDQFVPYIHSIKKLKNICDKDFMIHVPGSIGNYPQRKKVLNEIVSNKDLHSSNYITLLNHHKKIHMDTYEKKNLENFYLYNYFYSLVIEKSKYNYVDGGFMNVPVRKYVEVPSLGSCMISPNLPVLKEYGFTKNIDFIEYDERNNIKDLINDVSDTEYSRILNSSREKIKKNHTNEKRCDDFVKAFKKVLTNEYNGSSYIDGKLVFN